VSDLEISNLASTPKKASKKIPYDLLFGGKGAEQTPHQTKKEKIH